MISLPATYVILLVFDILAVLNPVDVKLGFDRNPFLYQTLRICEDFLNISDLGDKQNWLVSSKNAKNASQKDTFGIE